MAQCIRDTAAFLCIFESLSSCSTSPGCLFVAGVAVFAGWYKVWGWMVSPYVCGFHSGVTVLAVGYGVSWEILHEVHLSHAAAWVFDEPVSGMQFFDEVDYMVVYRIALLCVVCYGGQVAVFFSFPVVRDSGYRVGGAVWGCPYHIGDTAAQLHDLLCCQGSNVRTKCGIEVFLPIHRIHFVASRFEGV